MKKARNILGSVLQPERPVIENAYSTFRLISDLGPNTGTVRCGAKQNFLSRDLVVPLSVA